jgi:hypothetical protein
MAMIPYMAAGYAADRLMGGNGMTGLALGTGVGGFSTGAFGSLFAGAIPEAAATSAAATEAAAASFPTVLSTAGGAGQALTQAELAALASQSPNAGLIGQTISPFTPLGTQIGGATGLFGQEISNQAVNSALTGGKAFGGLFDSVPLDYLKTGTDFINDGWSDMSFADKAGALNMTNQAVDTMTAPQAMIQPPQRQEVIGKEPNIAAPLAINVPASGVNIRTTGQLERMLTPQQRKALGLL